ncbi:hypothetical protein [Nocardia abscessus]|uniref:hypothetical protein n=1 Tax=Nocardia abscessus TaxID=120957 RepID=UPI002454DB29|nr:hypothetical protein [Nocardia abscessus]
MNRSTARRRTVTITGRDAAVLKWLAEVQIASTDTMHNAYAHFGDTPMTKKRCSARLMDLVNHGYLGVAGLRRGNNRRVYWPAHQPYPVARRELAHDLIIADMSIKLLKAGGEEFLHYNRNLPAAMTSQPRQWTRDAPIDKQSHLGDGMLWLPNDTSVIVEIELANKSPQKLARVLGSHANRIASADEPAAHVLYLTTYRVGQVVAAAWAKHGHAADHPDRMQVIHVIDDTTLDSIDNARTIPIPS